MGRGFSGSVLTAGNRELSVCWVPAEPEGPGLESVTRICGVTRDK